MRVTQTTSPTTLPLALDDLKDHLRIERDELDYDDDLTLLIRTAASYIEDDCHVVLITTSFTATWDCTPGYTSMHPLYNRLSIPSWPVQTIDSITYKDTDGSTQTWASSEYRTNLTQVPATVFPEITKDWPVTQADASDVLTVAYTAGYGAAATDMPYQVQAMIKLLASHWFKHREAIGAANVPYKRAYDAMREHLNVNEFVDFLNQ